MSSCIAVISLICWQMFLFIVFRKMIGMILTPRTRIKAGLPISDRMIDVEGEDNNDRAQLLEHGMSIQGKGAQDNLATEVLI